MRLRGNANQIYFPQVAVSYNREYLISICGNIRVTIDFDIKFAKVNSSSKNSVNNWIPSNEEVMEIKYDAKDDNYCSNMINNEKSSRPLTSETRTRPEMRGPSDISDLLNGLKSKSDSINNKIDPFKNDRKSPGIAAVETKNIKSASKDSRQTSKKKKVTKKVSKK